MILPTKHITEDQTLLGVGAALLYHLAEPKTLSALWESVKNQINIANFEKFILGLDLLYIMGTISLHDGKIKKSQQ
jgi:hypothetical protein